MYVPAHFAMDDAAVRDLLDRHGAGDLVTATADGLRCTMLPFVHDASVGEHGVLLGHFARNNDHWQQAPVGEAMVILRGPDAYISPNWYASKAEHGRVVPTWNYVLVAVHGTVRVHDDAAWTRDIVERLTRAHEAGRPEPWAVSDAPPPYIEGQLKAIVGIEIEIERIEAKWKLSQNRSAEDVAGVIAGLGAGSDDDVALADAMATIEERRAGRVR